MNRETVQKLLIVLLISVVKFKRERPIGSGVPSLKNVEFHLPAVTQEGGMVPV